METVSDVHFDFINIKFKSYYVVWKPRKDVVKYSFSYCLNRTMQYGNSNTERKK